MRHDHLLDILRLDADHPESLRRAAQEVALARHRLRRVEADIDDDGAAAAEDGPDEIVHRHRPVMRVRSEEHTSEHQSLMRISSVDFCLKKKRNYKISM